MLSRRLVSGDHLVSSRPRGWTALKRLSLNLEFHPLSWMDPGEIEQGDVNERFIVTLELVEDGQSRNVHLEASKLTLGALRYHLHSLIPMLTDESRILATHWRGQRPKYRLTEGGWVPLDQSLRVDRVEVTDSGSGVALRRLLRVREILDRMIERSRAKNNQSARRWKPLTQNDPRV